MDDFDYDGERESRSSNLLTNKPYQLITADSLMDSDEEEENVCTNSLSLSLSLTHTHTHTFLFLISTLFELD